MMNTTIVAKSTFNVIGIPALANNLKYNLINIRCERYEPKVYFEALVIKSDVFSEKVFFSKIFLKNTKIPIV